MCINEFDKDGKKFPRTVFGTSGTEARTLDIMLITCLPKQLTQYNKHLVDKECIVDYKDPKSLERKLKESKDYLGRPQIKSFSNSQRLDLKKFGKNSVVNETVLSTR